MKEMIIAYWIEVVFGLILAAFASVYKINQTHFKKKLEEQDAIRLGVQALLRDRIIQSYNHYNDEQCVPIYARENLEHLYKQYKNLGGNGTITNLMEKLNDLPTPPNCTDDHVLPLK